MSVALVLLFEKGIDNNNLIWRCSLDSFENSYNNYPTIIRVERIAEYWGFFDLLSKRLGLQTWFRAHSKGRVKAHLLSIGHILLTLGVSEL